MEKDRSAEPRRAPVQGLGAAWASPPGQPATREKIGRAIMRRPSRQDFRAQLFWLVDLVYACKASEDAELRHHSQLLEQAMGCLSAFLENGKKGELDQVQAHLEAFRRFILGD